jgi:GNAT superfamily N-acetyltransferase
MEIHPLDREGHYLTRRLRPPDLVALQRLFVRAADYFMLSTGAPPAPDEAERAFVAGPPTKPVNAKRVIGLFTTDGTLVGVLDALTDWPADGTWSMGMLLLEPAHRGRGLGSRLLAAYETWARTQGAQQFRTALVAHHHAGIQFLERAGYTRESALADYDAGATRPTILFLAKPAARGEVDTP